MKGARSGLRQVWTTYRESTLQEVVEFFKANIARIEVDACRSSLKNDERRDNGTGAAGMPRQVGWLVGQKPGRDSKLGDTVGFQVSEWTHMD